MKEPKTYRVRLAALALSLGLVLAACGGGDGGAGGGGSGDLSGRISIDGSSTVAPVSEAVAEEFQREQPGVQVSVGTSGTGGGFKKFCNGEIDIADASRPIKDEEKQACEANGVSYKEIRVGLDGLAIVTSKDNDFVECLSYGDLQTIFKEGGASTWNQVDPSFPNEKIAIFAPDTESGTYDFFTEEVLGEDVEARTDYTASSDDNVLVQGISGEANSWGFFGFAYLQENEGAVKAIEVSEEEGGDCTAPTAETVASGDYPLSRPLFVYVKEEALERPEVEAFMRFYLEVAPELVPEVGYIASPEEDYQAGLDALGDA